MPEFQYACGHCGPFSIWKALTDLHPEHCPTCGGQDIRRVFTVPAVVVK